VPVLRPAQPCPAGRPTLTLRGGGAVTKLVETVQPTVDFSYHKYCQAHDVVVASEAYNRALETASAIIHKARAPSGRRAQLLRSPVMRLQAARRLSCAALRCAWRMGSAAWQKDCEALT
jgi:hypothetical protein